MKDCADGIFPEGPDNSRGLATTGLSGLPFKDTGPFWSSCLLQTFFRIPGLSEPGGLGDPKRVLEGSPYEEVPDIASGESLESLGGFSVPALKLGPHNRQGFKDYTSRVHGAFGCERKRHKDGVLG